MTLSFEPQEVELLVDCLEKVEDAMQDAIKEKEGMLKLGIGVAKLAQEIYPDSARIEVETFNGRIPEMEARIEKDKQELEQLTSILNRIAPERELKVGNV